MKKKWVFPKNVPDEIKSQLPDFDPVILQMLFNRGFTDPEMVQKFFKPEFEELTSPFLLTDMDIAVIRILSALAAKEKITIYADYDADAVTAAAVLYRGLVALGAKNPSYYIPDRFAEGYGVNEQAVEEIAKNGSKLMITVDCGISSVAEIELANKLGMDVVVTDHHHITGKLPSAAAIVNHKRDDYSDLAGLTGVGMAFKLVQALFFALYESEYQAFGWLLPTDVKNLENLDKVRNGLLPETVPHWEKWLLDLVAIGTVADLQSLRGESRTLVRYGLKVMKKTRWLGLRKILINAGIDNKEDYDTFDLGFIIAPRINAAGRIQHAEIALKLFISDNLDEVAMYAGQLEQLNSHRQRITERIFTEARSQIELRSREKILVAVGEEWPKGVVGLVASRLSDEFNRPTVVLEKSNGLATGSGRSIGSFNLVDALTHASIHLERYGGHAQAVGLTIKPEKIDVFKQTLLQFAEDKLTEDDLVRSVMIDAVVDPAELTFQFLNILRQFEPYGADNPSPILLIEQLAIENLRTMGADNRHLRLQASKDGKIYKMVGFRKAVWNKNYKPGDVVDVLVEPSENNWNGRKEVQLKMLEIKKNTNV